MLSLEQNSFTGEVRLLIRNDLAEAWISYYPPSFNPFDRHDWRLWVKRREHEPARARKSPTGLLIESRLRAWLLQRFRRRLRDLSFEELCAIAQGKCLTPRRRMKLGGKKG
jgi:hypothetical protein